MRCHITSLESCSIDWCWLWKPCGCDSEWAFGLSKTYGLNFPLIFWLSCYILTCCPTLSFSSVLHSCPHCSISSLPILQHPLLQTFMPPTSSPQNPFPTVFYIPYCNTLRLSLQYFFFLLSSLSSILGCLPQLLPLFPYLPAGLVQR